MCAGMMKFLTFFSSIPVKITIFASLFEGSCFDKLFETF